MADQPILSVREISKRYATRLRPALKYGMLDIARACIGRAAHATTNSDEFWALRDISFTLRPGDAMALLGANGSGKSTLLKIVYGILKPDHGEVVRRGRINGLLELGAGLDGRLSGHENIALRAAMQHGDTPTRKRMHERATDFCGLGENLDKPVQSYSSGMRARLSFGMAASTDADLLLVDEALAVGDHAFQSKCLRFLQDFVAQGGALLLTSHIPTAIPALCDRALHLAGGKGRLYDDPNDAMAALAATPERHSTPSAPTASVASKVATIERVTLNAPLRTREPMEIRVTYGAAITIAGGWGFSIWTADGSACVMGDYDLENVDLQAGGGELICRIPRLPLLPGAYCLGIAIVDRANGLGIDTLGWRNDGIPFDVAAPDRPVMKDHIFRTHRHLVAIDTQWEQR